MGQSEETDQVKMMKKMETEYEDLKERCHEQGFEVSVFDATLPTTSCSLRGETMEERARQLAKSGRVASAGAMFRFLGTMMYNSEDMLLARKIAREEKEKEVQEKDDAEENHAIDLFEKSDQAFMHFRDSGSLLSNIGKEPLQDIVRFICHQEKKKGDTYSKYSGSMKKMRERIAEVQPVWTKYFSPLSSEGEESEDAEEESESNEETPSSEGEESEDEEEEPVLLRRSTRRRSEETRTIESAGGQYSP